MKRGEDGDDFYQYSCMGDTEAYNKVYFTYDGEETDDVAFNDLVDGWYISSYGVLPCTEGVEYSRDIPLTRLTCLNECENFIIGFRLGVQLMTEALQAD